MSKRNFKKILITGISGSGGSYLADYILEHHPHVKTHGTVRNIASIPKNLDKSYSKLKIHECDLNDFSSILTVLKKVKPDVIFHLASNANVRASFSNPLAILENNIGSTANLLEATRLSGIDPVIQLCSTSEVYGQVDPKNVPIKEDCPINPANPYAVSKTTQDLLGAVYHKAYGMKIIRTRMFAYINPRRENLFATAFAMQVARIEAGLQKILLHGNLNSTRTLIDVRDAMESYWVAAEKCRFGEVYNIGGNTIITVGEFLELLRKKAHIPILLRQDPNLLRPTDVTLQVPDVSKFKKETGWKPKYSFEDSVDLLLAYCRAEVKAKINLC
ncbi:MAG TPA: GDP-mannose 4,6-dehydratase [Patescibacteria group bacterium]|nr:GDP-mannose 4,6-dehydratase [Patescibacteria group bacterium]